jgi:hypothetical protein
MDDPALDAHPVADRREIRRCAASWRKRPLTSAQPSTSPATRYRPALLFHHARPLQAARSSRLICCSKK